MNWNNDSMSCDRARESIADSIIGRGAIADASAVDAHLAGCAACRAYRAECEAMWSALGELPVPAAAPDARARSTPRCAVSAPRRMRSLALVERDATTAHRRRRRWRDGAWLWRGVVERGASCEFARGVVARIDGRVAAVSPVALRHEATGLALAGAARGIIAEYSAWAREV